MLAVKLISIQMVPAFAAHPQGWPWWCLVLLAMAAILVMALAINLERSSRGRRARLAISNRGNAPSRYELCAEGSAGELKFNFYVEGRPLPRQEYAETVAVPQGADSVTRPAGQAPASAQAAAANGLLNIGAAISDLLYSLSMILPGSLARSTGEAAGSIRRAQYTGNRVMQLPGQASRMVQAGAGTVSGVATARPTVPVAQETTRTVRRVWAQTPAVQPGETLVLQAEFWTGRSADLGNQEVSIFSRSLEQPGAVPLITTDVLPTKAAHGSRRLAGRFLMVVASLAAVVFVTWFIRSGMPVVW